MSTGGSDGGRRSASISSPMLTAATDACCQAFSNRVERSPVRKYAPTTSAATTATTLSTGCHPPGSESGATITVNVAMSRAAGSIRGATLSLPCPIFAHEDHRSGRVARRWYSAGGRPRPRRDVPYPQPTRVKFKLSPALDIRTSSDSKPYKRVKSGEQIFESIASNILPAHFKLSDARASLTWHGRSLTHRSAYSDAGFRMNLM